MLDGSNISEKNDIRNEEKIHIIREIIGRIPYWESPGPGLVQWLWLNNYSTFHEGISLQIQEFLDNFVPTWMENGENRVNIMIYNLFTITYLQDA